jgi:hypothetical protein
MDEDTIELILQLCTRIGMIMEDASVVALLNKPGEHLPGRVAALCNVLDRARALARAAHALCDG